MRKGWWLRNSKLEALTRAVCKDERVSFLGVSFTKVTEHTKKTGQDTTPSVSQSVSSRSPRAHRTIVSKDGSAAQYRTLE